MRKALFEPSKLMPRQVVAVALLVAFLAFIVFDQLEQAIVGGQSTISLRMLHFVRGFLATTGGMLFVWWIMQKKERELSALRDDLSRLLEVRTSEVAKLTEQAFQRNQKVDAIIGSMGEALVEIDDKGLVVATNRRVGEMLGLEPHALLGGQAAALGDKFRCADGNKSISLATAIANGTSLCMDDAIYDHPSGKKLLVGWSLAPILMNDKLIGSVLTLADVTERRRLQAALLQQREDFLAVISHRLRTPILANQRTIALLLENEFGALTDKQAEILHLMGDNNRQVNRLLEMLVDIYRYRNGNKELKLREVDIRTLVKESIENVNGLRKTKRLVLGLNTSEDDSLVTCDIDELKKLMSHLVENAFRYAQSTVQVTVDRNEHGIRLGVKDDGKGMPAQDVAGLFDRFYQMSSDGKYAPSTGTGLCLCAEIARAHKGTLECKSAPGEGTEFVLALPMVTTR